MLLYLDDDSVRGEDFTLLHDLVLLAGGHHPGILVVRRDNNPIRDMSPGAIVRAIHPAKMSPWCRLEPFAVVSSLGL